MEKREHLNEINLVRALAITGVVMVHSTSSAVVQMAQTKWLFLYNFLNILSKLGTPTFIFLSSFVLFYNYFPRPYEAATLVRFYKRRLLYIVAPYLVFSGIYFLIKNHAAIEPGNLFNIAKYFAKLLLTGHAHDHLYFVIISIQFYILFPLLLWGFQKIKWAQKYAVLIGLIIQWLFFLLNNRYLHITNKGSICISWTSYYMMGVFFGIYYTKIKEWILIKKANLRTPKSAIWAGLWVIWISTAFLHIGLWYRTRAFGAHYPSFYYEALYNLYGLSSALILFQSAFFLYKHASPRLVKILHRYGSHSFGVYLFHPLVLRYYRLTQPSTGTYGYFAWIVGGFLCAVLLSWLVVDVVSNRFKFSWIFFGNPSAKSSAKRSSPQVIESKQSA